MHPSPQSDSEAGQGSCDPLECLPASLTQRIMGNLDESIDHGADRDALSLNIFSGYRQGIQPSGQILSAPGEQRRQRKTRLRTQGTGPQVATLPFLHGRRHHQGTREHAVASCVHSGKSFSLSFLISEMRIVAPVPQCGCEDQMRWERPLLPCHRSVHPCFLPASLSLCDG